MLSVLYLHLKDAQQTAAISALIFYVLHHLHCFLADGQSTDTAAVHYIAARTFCTNLFYEPFKRTFGERIIP